MKPNRCLLAVVVCCLPLFARASNAPDGYAWSSWAPNFKLGFVVGYLQASDTAGAVSMSACMTTLNYLDPTKVSAEKWKNMCLNDKMYDFSGISMGQFVDGVDVFYRDYRNKNLEVAFALQYVRDQMHGKTSQELSAELAQWQKIQQESSKQTH